jgi:preprotein translocase subunit SecF
MEFFRIQRVIPFMRHVLVLNVISILFFAAAVGAIAVRGLNFSIEFTGGTVMEVSYPKPADLERIRSTVVEMGYADAQVQNFGTSRDVMIRLPLKDGSGTASARQSEQVMEKLKGVDASVELKRVEFVGPQVGAELFADGALALLIVIVGIMVYLALRFEWKFAVAAIVANLHDVIIIVGFFALFQWEFSLSVLAAVLAVLGYSVNESVVIFDRIRESFRKMRRASTEETIDYAITSTISRTAMTHGSTQIMVLTILIFGGPTLFYFALALTIGILFGIYSSIFVAAGVTLWLGLKREDLVKPVKKKDDAEVELP